MLTRSILKRFCHTHSPSLIPNYKSKCYENTHHLVYLRQDITEIKNILECYHQPLKLMYFASGITFGGTLILVLSK